MEGAIQRKLLRSAPRRKYLVSCFAFSRPEVQSLSIVESYLSTLKIGHESVERSTLFIVSN